MDSFLRDIVEQLKRTITFLDKLKLNKNQKTEKETIVESLKQLSERCSKNADRSNGDQETYDDVVIQPGEETYDAVGNDENYDDVQGRRGTEDDGEGFYDDTSADTYDDVSAQPKEIQPIECEKLIRPLISDFLEIKKDSSLKMLLKSSWQKRWCVLHGNVLYIYESAKDKRQKEAFDLSGYKFQAREDITKEAKRKDRCFEIKNDETQKTYEFCAVDKDMMSKWRAVLTKNTKCGSVSSISTSQDAYDDVGVETGSTSSHLDQFDSTKKKKGILPKWGGKRPKSFETEEENTYDDTQAGDIYEETGDANYDDTRPSFGQNYDDTGFPAPPPEEDGILYEEYEEDKKTPARDNLPLPRLPGNLNGPRRSSTKDELPPLPTTPKPTGSPSMSSREETGSASGTYNMRNRPPMPIPTETPNKRELPAPPPGLLQDRKDTLPPYPEPIKEESNDEDVDDLSVFGEDKDDYENMYQGMWDCVAEENNELNFKRGEVIHIISKEYEDYGWWTAESKFLNVGLVPMSYLMKAYDI